MQSSIQAISLVNTISDLEQSCVRGNDQKVKLATLPLRGLGKLESKAFTYEVSSLLVRY